MIRIVKKAETKKINAYILRVLIIILSLVATGVFLEILGHDAIDVYVKMLQGAFGSAFRIKETLNKTIPLTITSLGIILAFKMKFWNIGAEGQIMIGAFSASAVALNLSHLNKPTLLILMMVAAIIGGGIWALVPAFFKVKFGVNETIFTLMLNYIAIKWVTYLQYGPWKDPSALGFPTIPMFERVAILPKVFGVHIGWIVAIILTIIIYIFMNHTKKGFEIAVVGESIDTARYSGMNVKKVIVTTMILSGGLCGLAGMIQASAIERTLSVYLSGGYGYTAIITAWLSGLNAFVAMITSFLFAVLLQGGSYIQTSAQIPQSVAQIIQSVILFFVLGGEFFINYKVVLKKDKA